MNTDHFITAFYLFWGAIFGSFFCALSWRIEHYFYSQARKSGSFGARLGKMFTRPSHCPSCNQSIGWLFLIPIVGYVLSMGRCRKCGVVLSPVYTFGEVFMALLVYGLFAGRHPAQLALTEIAAGLCWIVAAGLLYVIAYIDARRLSIDLPVLGLFSLCVVSARLIEAGFRFGPLEPALFTAAGAFVFFLLVFLFSGGRLGFGDVLLAGPLGLMVGHPWWMFSFNGSFIAASVLGILFYLRRGSQTKTSLWKTKLPLGTFLAGCHLLVFWYVRVLNS